MKLLEQLTDERVTFVDAPAVLLTEEPGDGDLQALGRELQVHDQVLEVDEVGLDNVGLGAVLHNVLTKPAATCLTSQSRIME